MIVQAGIPVSQHVLASIQHTACKIDERVCAARAVQLCRNHALSFIPETEQGQVTCTHVEVDQGALRIVLDGF